MSEDLSLGLILDDRDDSVFAGGWSDEDEELEDEFVCTPRHLPTLDENDDSETDFNLQQRRLPSRYSIILKMIKLMSKIHQLILGWHSSLLAQLSPSHV